LQFYSQQRPRKLFLSLAVVSLGRILKTATRTREEKDKKKLNFRMIHFILADRQSIPNRFLLYDFVMLFSPKKKTLLCNLFGG
jgi:hypothetical protein